MNRPSYEALAVINDHLHQLTADAEPFLTDLLPYDGTFNAKTAATITANPEAIDLHHAMQELLLRDPNIRFGDERSMVAIKTSEEIHVQSPDTVRFGNIYTKLGTIARAEVIIGSPKGIVLAHTYREVITNYDTEKLIVVKPCLHLSKLHLKNQYNRYVSEALVPFSDGNNIAATQYIELTK